MDLSQPDKGLVMALELPERSREGLAFDLGFGSGRHLKLLSQYYPSRTQGFELQHHYIEEAQSLRDAENLQYTVMRANVLDLEFVPNTLAVASTGVVIYNPKSVVFDLFRRLWLALKPFGILHVEFPTTRDCTLTDDFVEFTCLPFPESEHPNSYMHYCGYSSCQFDHPGVYGYSLWEENEAEECLFSLGSTRIVHRDLQEWTQVLTSIESDALEAFTEERKRSFYILTAQKLA